MHGLPDEIIMPIGITILAVVIATTVLYIVATTIWYTSKERRPLARRLLQIMACMAMGVIIGGSIVGAVFGIGGADWRDPTQLILQALIFAGALHLIKKWCDSRHRSSRSNGGL